MGAAVHILSLDRVASGLDHLRQGHHTALVGSPGCGMTTFVSVATGISADGFIVHYFDSRTKGVVDLLRELKADRSGDAPRRVVVLDHCNLLLPDDYRKSLSLITECVANTGALLWCGKS